MSLVKRKPDFNSNNWVADQCLCFRYTDSAIPLLLKTEISSILPSSVTVYTGLCRTLENPKARFPLVAAHIILSNFGAR